MIRKHYKEVKTVLKKSKFIDSYFITKFAFSPYMACEHGCKYCDGRAERYYVEGNFEKDIVIRKNLAEQLDKDLSKLRDKGIAIVGSGISDSYQPIELEEELMRESLKVLIKHKQSCMIITKSSNILRDIDLLKELNMQAGVTIALSLAFPDDKDRKIIEPAASSIDERIDTILRIKELGIGVGVMAMPILPMIVDNENDLVRLFDLYKSLDVDFVLPGSLTLRPGKNKQVFFDMLNEYYPQYLPAYKKIYSQNFTSGSPNWLYSKPFYSRVEALMKERELSPVIPLKLYKNRFPKYDVIYIYLKQLKFLYKDYTKSINRLVSSYNDYKEWYIEFNSRIRSSRKITYLDLESEFDILIKTGMIEELINNDKLYQELKNKALL